MESAIASLLSLKLPIVPHLECISSGIRDSKISLIQAPPGSGKTTVLPLFLAGQPWLAGKKILVLQPRRLAAKAVASRMAELIGEPVGETVGYRIRLENKGSARTRVEVITEGLLTRMIVTDPALSGIGLIIFDEFHERSLHADIGLGLSREVIGALREDLRVVIMSATLSPLLHSTEIPDAWRYSFDTAPHPVQVNYVVPEQRRPLWDEAARVIRNALSQHKGDLLAFLPGAFEIERCCERLQDCASSLDLIPLYGELPYERQRIALEPSSRGFRKVILATPIAETSLTIDGVRIVVDSGLHRVSRSEITGVSHLKTERITLDSADQRAGRAARTGPGTCIRMWSEAEHRTLRPAREPEVLRSDLAQSVLELAAWGLRDPLQFSWITRPSDNALAEATKMLRDIQAINLDGSITSRGESLVALGTHPRIGNLCLAARSHGHERYAAALIPILEERIPQSLTSESSDIGRLVESLLSGSRICQLPPRIVDLSDRWLRRLQALPRSSLPERQRCPQNHAISFLLATAFPDRIAKRRADGEGRYILSAGKGVVLSPRDPLVRSEYLVVASLLKRESDSEVSLATALNPELFEGLLGALVQEETIVDFDDQRGQLRASRIKRCGAVILRDEPLTTLPNHELKRALLVYLRTPQGGKRIPFSDKARALQNRAIWARRRGPKSIPDISDEALARSEPFWLEDVLPEDGRLSRLTEQAVEQALGGLFTWLQQRELDEVAPQTMTLPSGKARELDYSSGEGPALHATIQELFGVAHTPRVGILQETITLYLLSPARRPMQVTRDLAGFWRGSYQQIRKELRGRYPKHRWPEDPTVL